MPTPFQELWRALLASPTASRQLGMGDPTDAFEREATTDAARVRKLNSAFLEALAGPDHPRSRAALEALERSGRPGLAERLAEFYRDALDRIGRESEETDPAIADAMSQVAGEIVSDTFGSSELAERIWSVFFPQGVGIRHQRSESIEALRQKRTVRIRRPNPRPLRDPARQVLFTSNALLTLPPSSADPDHLPLDPELVARLKTVMEEPQAFWYDHPIQIGVAPSGNEVLYGLKGLAGALRAEKERGVIPPDARLTCALSVSVTHEGLGELARPYLAAELGRAGGLEDLDVYLFTEPDVRLLVADVLAPAAERFLGRWEAQDALAVFGVDGPYGRHYSFLKAVAPLWRILLDPGIEATFKIDLDQVFPQRELVEQTGRSAFEHLMTPLWGADAVDATGQTVELGLVAGALVNERDIGSGVFTPDVRFPHTPPEADEHVFYSRLPQALSTEAEMMTRYGASGPDGADTALERVHVTGGTNGVLVDALRRHRPFTPGFIGRAEDQAYVLSTYAAGEPRLAYVHQPGLIMRHDKEAFALEAMAAARVGKAVGDYVRILHFSGYARALGLGPDDRARLDPFTGCFISRLPVTVTLLRFALRLARALRGDSDLDGNEVVEFAELGVRRLSEALELCGHPGGRLEAELRREREAWDLYYDTLTALESALHQGEAYAEDLREQARHVIGACRVLD